MSLPNATHNYQDLTFQPPVVFDTNVLITAMLNPHSTAAQAMQAAILSGAAIVQTPETRAELHEKILGDNVKPFLADRLSLPERQQFYDDVVSITRLKPAAPNFAACRDVKDNMMVDAAIAARAGYIVSGDKDLLVLGQVAGITHPIHIVHAVGYLRHCEARDYLIIRQQEIAKAFGQQSHVNVISAPNKPAANERQFLKASSIKPR